MFSIVAEISLLFWSATAEVEVSASTKTLLKHAITLTAYDTLSGKFVEEKSTDLDPKDFLKRAMEARVRISEVLNRLESVLSELHPLRIASEDDASRVVVKVVLAPWTILPEWHQLVSKWTKRTPPGTS
jgi:hypothetical protein